MVLLLSVQVAIFAFAAWAGSAHGGVIAGLSVCGLVMASTSSAATLMQVRPLWPLALPMRPPLQYSQQSACEGPAGIAQDSPSGNQFRDMEVQMLSDVQDFKTGHITMSSPRSMFLSQLAGAFMGESCT